MTSASSAQRLTSTLVFLLLLPSCGKTTDGSPATEVSANPAPKMLGAEDAAAGGGDGDGDGDGGADADASVPDTLAALPTITAWSGYIDRSVTYPEPMPNDQPQRVHVVLDTTAGVSGTIQFGDAAIPAVDPAVYYPPGLEIRNVVGHPVDGFAYPLKGSRIGDEVLNVYFSPGDLWADWCALQTSYPTDWINDQPVFVRDGSEFSCAIPGEPLTSCSYEPSDCLRSTLCVLAYSNECGHRYDPACRCDETGCWASALYERKVDFVFRDGGLEGQMAGAVVDRTMKLRRVE